MPAMARVPRARVPLVLRIAHLVLTILAYVAEGQVFDFKEVPVPEARTLSTHYLFYVYTEQDAPKAGVAAVQFNDLVVKSTGSASAALADYKGLQVSILPFKDFWQLVNPTKFCATAEDTAARPELVQDQLMLAPSGAGTAHVVSRTLGLGPQAAPAEAEASLTTGVYVLVFSNCGQLEGLSVTGSVAVQNAWGFLPAIEYYKKPMYGYSAILYAIVSATWAVLALRWWKQLYYFQKGITVVALLGTLEAILWWAFFNYWNDTGSYSNGLFLAAGLSSVGKLVVAFRLLLLTALDKEGLGGTELDGGTSLKVHLALMMYMVLEFNVRTVMSHRHSRALKMSFVAANVAPAVLMGVLLFVWAHIALSGLLEALRDKKDEQKVSIFARTQVVLWCATLFAAAAVSLQLFDPTVQDDTSVWKYHAMCTDGVAHILFALVLFAAMIVWLPSESVQGYEYALQAQDANVIGAPSGVIWDDNALDEEAVGGEGADERGGRFGAKGPAE